MVSKERADVTHELPAWSVDSAQLEDFISLEATTKQRPE
jgi:hypothetical protein